MIKKGSEMYIATIPICNIHVNAGECGQTRYPDRVLHYVKLMTAHPEGAPGLLSVQPSPYHRGMYELLDGHHRFIAYILMGRKEALCVVIKDTHPPAA